MYPMRCETRKLGDGVKGTHARELHALACYLQPLQAWGLAGWSEGLVRWPQHCQVALQVVLVVAAVALHSTALYFPPVASRNLANLSMLRSPHSIYEQFLI